MDNIRCRACGSTTYVMALDRGAFCIKCLRNKPEFKSVVMNMLKHGLLQEVYPEAVEPSRKWHSKEYFEFLINNAKRCK